MVDESRDGVYGDDGTGTEQLVHAYTEDDYNLEDIHHSFGLGKLESGGDGTALELDGSEIRRLKVLADAESFDHPEDFIMMCLDMYRFASGLGAGPHRFTERVD